MHPSPVGIVSHTAPSHGNSTTSSTQSHPVLNPAGLVRLRAVLLGLTLFVGLVIWVAFWLGVDAPATHLVTRLRALGVMTWLFALVQIIDMKVWHSRFALRRRAASRIPESLEGWLLAQMMPWFGIAYYALTEDPRWFIGGLVLFLLSFVVFPIRDEH